MILQIDTQEWCLLQDALNGLCNTHSPSEVELMKQKLNSIFIEQSFRPEDTND